MPTGSRPVGGLLEVHEPISAASVRGGFPADCVHLESYGNVLAATAFLQGLASEELKNEELITRDPDYEMLIAVRAQKPAGAAEARVGEPQRVVSMRLPPGRGAGKATRWRPMAEKARRVKNVHDLGLVEALRALRRQLWLVLGVAAAVAAVAVGPVALAGRRVHLRGHRLFPQRGVGGRRARPEPHYRTALIAPRPDAGREVVSTARTRFPRRGHRSHRGADRRRAERRGAERACSTSSRYWSRISSSSRPPPRDRGSRRSYANAFAREYDRISLRAGRLQGQARNTAGQAAAPWNPGKPSRHPRPPFAAPTAADPQHRRGAPDGQPR